MTAKLDILKIDFLEYASVKVKEDPSLNLLDLRTGWLLTQTRELTHEESVWITEFDEEEPVMIIDVLDHIASFGKGWEAELASAAYFSMIMDNIRGSK